MWRGHHFQGQKVFGQGHQAPLLTAALTRQAAAAVSVGTWCVEHQSCLRFLSVKQDRQCHALIGWLLWQFLTFLVLALALGALVLGIVALLTLLVLCPGAMHRPIIKCMRSEDGWLVGWLVDYMGKHLCDAKFRIFHLEWRHIFDWSGVTLLRSKAYNVTYRRN